MNLALRKIEISKSFYKWKYYFIFNYSISTLKNQLLTFKNQLQNLYGFNKISHICFVPEFILYLYDSTKNSYDLSNSIFLSKLIYGKSLKFTINSLPETHKESIFKVYFKVKSFPDSIKRFACKKLNIWNSNEKHLEYDNFWNFVAIIPSTNLPISSAWIKKEWYNL